MENIENIITSISNVGFPVVLSIFLLLRFEKKIDELTKAIKWFENRKGKVSYSMQNRNGTSSYDCSSSLYYALRSAGANSNGWTIDTKHEHFWLEKNGFEKITDNVPWKAKRGDIFIWGKRENNSSSYGHTGIFIDENRIIHCNYSANGISVDNHDRLWVYAGRPHYFVYRLKEFQDEGEYMELLNIKSKIKGYYSIDSLPWFCEDKSMIGTTQNHQGEEVTLTRKWGSYYYVKELKGWVDYRAFINENAIREVAKEVIQGNWGNGELRRARLENAGYNYEEVQKEVNRLLKSK